MLSLSLQVVLNTGLAQAQERHADYPMSTKWEAYSLGRQARAQSGLASAHMVVLFVEPDAGWYTYAQDPGGFGKPTRLTASLDIAKTPLTAYYPPGKPKQDAFDPTMMVNAYMGRTPLFLPLPEAANLPQAITANLDLLLCTKDKCLPTRVDLRFAVSGSAELPDASRQPWWPNFLAALKLGGVPPGQATALSAAAPAATAPLAGEAGPWQGLKPRYLQPGLEVGGLAKAILLGLLAGFVLNFMPCALPVISIKLSSLLAGGGGDNENTRRHKIREHFLYLALGALTYFMFLAALFGYTDLAWGQLFQQPSVVLALTVIVFALSLSLLGVFSLPVIDLKFDQMTTHPKLQSFFTGMLTTLLATPCSGPFLGGVLGWALLQPPFIITTVLMSIGLGMASPYLLICVFPALVRFTPKPGPWMGYVERLVALFLMGTCIYLLNILPETMLVSTLVLLLVTAVSCTLWGLAGPGFDTRRSVALKALAVLLIAASAYWVLQPRVKTQWERYSTQTLSAELGKELVLVDFTADWCPTCKVLEQTVLTPARMQELESTYGLKLLKADLTEGNPEADALLAALGSKSIPLLAIFPKNSPQEPVVLRDLFTPQQLEEAVANAAKQ
ncbi:MAG: thioredoxin family protein [Proteobacteria bacterium]|nr:thioredoxin family protein [Pseudomonadota bacterium]